MFFSGSIKAWDDLVNGRSDIGEAFDTVGGTVIEAAAGAMGGKTAKGKVGGGKFKAVQGKFKAVKDKFKSRGGKSNAVKGKTGGSKIKARGGKSNTARGKVLCKRSIEEISNFNLGQPDLPTDLLAHLPGSFSDLTFNNRYEIDKGRK